MLTTAIQTIASSNALVSAWGPNYHSRFKKGDVENGCVRVDKLEQVHLPGEAVLIVGSSWRILPVSQPHSQFAVHEFDRPGVVDSD